jgi:acetyl/propionyl-CoA carboxylase alpha subunit
MVYPPFQHVLMIAGKHIEIQIFGDSQGNCISLFERECSIQRRHQKVIEEAPSPYMTPDLRAKMSQAATELGRLLKYEGAGTVEFIVDAKTGGFYFLEVNTRVQVEHPITEETTLVDIVALQIYVASGGLLKDLPYLQNLKQHVLPFPPLTIYQAFPRHPLPPASPLFMVGPRNRTPSLRRRPK